MRVHGVDFTSAPRRDKPIVVAECETAEEDGSPALELLGFREFHDWPAYEQWLAEDAEWIGGFDFPFGLPERFVEARGWPADWGGMVRACVSEGKERFTQEGMRAFVGAREWADKHRRTDLAAGSHSPLKTRANPPVGLMFYEGAWRLLDRGVHVPCLNETDSGRIALESYPGMLAAALGVRGYKNDSERSAGTNAAARRRILERLAAGEAPFPKVRPLRAELMERLMRPSGDWLDALLCAVQAAWGWERRRWNFGLPADFAACEGWIVSAQPKAS